MPINTKYPLADVIAAAEEFDRRVTFEYVMLGGVNDGPSTRASSRELARECRAFVNLIPLHPGGAGDFTPTTAEDIRRFADVAAARRRRGRDPEEPRHGHRRGVRPATG